MPSAMVAADHLPKSSSSLYIEVCRNLQASDRLVIRVLLPIQLVGEQLLHLMPAIFAWRQADGVHHNQIHRGFSRFVAALFRGLCWLRSQTKVRGVKTPRKSIPTFRPKRQTRLIWRGGVVGVSAQGSESWRWLGLQYSPFTPEQDSDLGMCTWQCMQATMS